MPNPDRNSWTQRLVAAKADTPWSQNISIHFGRLDFAKGSDSWECASSLLMQTYVEGNVYMPLLTLNQTEAQALMDSLWDCGVRPTEGSGSAGAMLAVRDHLKAANADIAWLRTRFEYEQGRVWHALSLADPAAPPVQPEHEQA